MSSDLTHLERAADLARRARPHPNPMVGAVVVRDGVVVGEGFHTGPGADHAEVVALAQAGTSAERSTVYVTLEPCAHHGRTPPCVDALIAAGVARVVVGAEDPDTRVAGAGLDRLEQAGIEVVLVPTMAETDPAYMHHRRFGRPLVTVKMALTLDGQIAAADGTSQWITGEIARTHAHQLRAGSDAVLVGAGTLLADDPQLDVRLPNYDGPQPRPVIFAGTRPLPADRRIWARDPLVIGTEATAAPGPITVVPASADGRPDLLAALRAVGDEGYLDVLVEGGAALSGALWEQDLVDRGVLYLGAKVAGGLGMAAFAGTFATLADARPVTVEAVERIGQDVMIEFTTR